MSARPASRQRQREGHLPDEVRILFMGESPPDGAKFFYDRNAPSNLDSATKQAFETASRSLGRESDFLDAVSRLGCYQEDLSVIPVNKLSSSEKRQAWEAGVQPLAKRIRGFSPWVAVVIGITVSPCVINAVELAGLGDVERDILPFPMSRPRRTDGIPYRQAYVDKLIALVQQWRRRRLLAS